MKFKYIAYTECFVLVCSVVLTFIVGGLFFYLLKILNLDYFSENCFVSCFAFLAFFIVISIILFGIVSMLILKELKIIAIHFDGDVKKESIAYWVESKRVNVDFTKRKQPKESATLQVIIKDVGIPEFRAKSKLLGWNVTYFGKDDHVDQNRFEKDVIGWLRSMKDKGFKIKSISSYGYHMEFRLELGLFDGNQLIGFIEEASTFFKIFNYHQ